MASKKQEEPSPSLESRQENVITRVSNLPLVSSAYDLAAFAYAWTKENHPYVKAVLDLAEEGVKHISEVAATSAQPFLTKLEPQVSAAGQYASRGLDKLEEKLPILHQTADQVISDTQKLVLSKVVSAKEAVTKAVQSGKEMVVDTRMGKMALSGAEAMLEKSEELLDHYLPRMDEELAEPAESAPAGADAASENPSYLVRLGSLSSKLRHRAYQRAVVQVKTARDNIREAFSQLRQYIGQIEQRKEDLVQEGGEKLHQIESQTLDMSSHITEQLKTTFKNLIANIQGPLDPVLDEQGNVAERTKPNERERKALHAPKPSEREGKALKALEQKENL
ncbi:perilipin-3-like isoform X2 [Heteronotia binoei]|uniref:perilipin-3-like isoform X2 n=1 Tax=Heteronotia binoei TaxID=13085 RepID=UPI0029310B3E|nr:perilipin-3-like isoform X2 [Heteronotia binoei]XP_060101868.1 perilipin-3-like isoform X2 [Heteronotia binoei]